MIHEKVEKCTQNSASMEKHLGVNEDACQRRMVGKIILALPLGFQQR